VVGEFELSGYRLERKGRRGSFQEESRFDDILESEADVKEALSKKPRPLG
jgi:hypothetical protein